jgi:hypothetical protein
MAIDKIIQEFEIRTQKAEAELKELDQRLGRIEKDGKQAGKATGDAFAKGSKKAKSSLKGVQNQSSELQNTVKRLGQTIAAAFAVREIINFTKRSIELANVQQAAEAQLLTALRGRKDVQQALIAQAAGLQKITTFGDEQIIQAQSMIAAFVQEEDQIKELTRVSLDFAAAKGVDLKTASDLITKTFASSTNALSRYGLSVEGAAGSQERLESVTGALDKAFKGQAETLAQTGTGQMQQFQNAVGDLQEEFGKRLLPVLNRAAKSLTEFLQSTDPDDIIKMAEAAGKLVLVFGAFKLGKLISSFRTLNLTMAANPVGAVLSALTALAAFLPDIIDAFDGVSETQKAIKEAGDKATESLIKEKVELNELATALKTTNPESKERAELLDEFNKLAGTNLQNLEDETANYYQLQAAVNAANNEFDRRITLAAKEAMAQKAKELQLEAQVKQEQIIRKLQEQGISKEEALRKVQEKREQTGKNLLRIGLGLTGNTAAFYDANDDLIFQLAELQSQEKEATDELQLLSDTFQDTGKKIKEIDFGAIGKEFKLTGEQIKKLTDESKKLGLTEPEVRNLARTLAGKGTKKEPTLAGAFEALNKEASDLKANLMEAIAQGNMADAKAYAASLGEVEGKLRNISSIAKGLMGELDFDISPEEEAELNIAPDIDFEALAKEFDIPINKTKELIDVYDEAMAKQDEMFEKALKQGEGIDEQKQKQISLEDGLQEGLQRTSELTGTLMTLAANRGGAYADFAKQLAVANLAVNKAQAISAAIAGATAAAAAKGPGAPFLIAGYIASMIATVVSGFAEIDSIMNTPQPQPPQFFEGTDYLTRNGAPAGRDTIPAMLNEGEAIIPTADNAKYPGLAKSWIDGDLDRFIYRNWVAPALQEAEAKKNESMADNLAKSIAMNMKGGFDDYRLYRTNRQGNSLLAQIADNTRPRINKKRRYN